jgi:hypothetical protein
MKYSRDCDVWMSDDYSRAMVQTWIGYALYECSNKDENAVEYDRVGMVFKARQANRWLKNKKVKYATFANRVEDNNVG